MHIWFWGDFGRDFRLRESFWLFPLLHQNRLWLQLGPRRQRCVDCACNVIPTLSLCNLWILTNLIKRWRTHHWAPQTAFQMTGSPPPETSAPDNSCLKSSPYLRSHKNSWGNFGPVDALLHLIHVDLRVGSTFRVWCHLIEKKKLQTNIWIKDAFVHVLDDDRSPGRGGLDGVGYYKV